MSYPRYPKYKASGVEWLGDVPEGWEVKRLKHNVRLLTGKTDRRDHPVALENIEGWSGRFIPTETAFEGEGVAFDTGDILFGKLRPYLAKAYLAGFSGEAVGDFHVMRPSVSIDGRFAQYQILNREFIAIVDGSTFGSKMPRASWEFVGGMKVTKPPLAEQTAIAEFLDRETAKIDDLVAEQRRLMELLKEKRQAVISHAVPKGLKPHAPMKPSGIEWLGNVPDGWVIGKLGYACKLNGGFAFAAGDFGTDGVAVVKMNNLKRGILDLSEAARIPESSCNESVSLLEGDLVWGMSGSTGETGSLGNFARVQAADLPCQLNQRVGRFKPDSSKLDLDFIEQVIQTPYFYEQIMLLVTGTAQYNVSSEQVQSCIFALPSLSEQTVIVEFLKTETAKFDTLTAEAQRAIDLLQERRTALISAAVTGQIDVRQQPRN